MFWVKYMAIFATVSVVCSTSRNMVDIRVQLLERKIHENLALLKDGMAELITTVKDSGLSTMDNLPKSITTLETKVVDTAAILKKAFQDEKRWFREQTTLLGGILTQVSKNVQRNNAGIHADIAATNHSIQQTHERLGNVIDSVKVVTDSIITDNAELRQEIRALTSKIQESDKHHQELLQQLLHGLWKRNGNSFYFIGSGELTWNEAKRWCENIGGHLPEVVSKDDQEYLKSLVKSVNSLSSSSYGVWLGGSDVDNEGAWIWMYSKRPLVFTAWKKDEPNNDGGRGHCLHLYKSVDYLWNDLSCDRKLAFICEAN